MRKPGGEAGSLPSLAAQVPAAERPCLRERWGRGESQLLSEGGPHLSCCLSSRYAQGSQSALYNLVETKQEHENTRTRSK